MGEKSDDWGRLRVYYGGHPSMSFRHYDLKKDDAVEVLKAPLLGVDANWSLFKIEEERWLLETIVPASEEGNQMLFLHVMINAPSREVAEQLMKSAQTLKCVPST